MPDSPSDPSRHPKPALPARRSDGAKPRAFADQTAEPIGLPEGDLTLSPPPADLLAKRDKSALPSQRKKDRDLPTLTPAPYQSEPTPGTAPGVRAELPGRRSPDELPKFRPPTEFPEPPLAPTPASLPSDPADVFPHEPTPAPPRPIKHRLAANRQPEMVRQGTVELDPETNDHWGQAAENTDTEYRGSGRRVALWAAVIATPLLGFALWQSMGRPGSPTPPPTAPIVAPSRSTTDPAEESRQASEVINRFMTAATIEERAAFVRHPEVTKARMTAWHSAANPLKPQPVLEFHDRSAEQTIDGVTFLMMTMNLPDFPKGRSIAVEKQANGGFLVDWESFAFWSEPRWPEFLSKEPEGAFDFRVVVEIDNYFNFGYTDPKKWFCYRLADPENWASCWGYCSIDSESGMKLNRMIRRQRQEGKDNVKAILKLKFEAAGKGRNQVVIEDVVQDGWIKVGP